MEVYMRIYRNSVREYLGIINGVIWDVFEYDGKTDGIETVRKFSGI